MIDFLEQHGFEPLEWFNDFIGSFHSVQKENIELVVGLWKDEEDIKCVYLVVHHDPPEGDDFGGERNEVLVPNCDNKLALYTLLHNFNLLLK